MVDLSKCQFLSSYDTNFCSNIVDSFYSPALSNSVSYDRQSGYFSSSSLAIASEGIIGLIENGGTMRLLTSPIISEDDLAILEKISNDVEGLTNELSKIIEKNLDEEFLRNESTEALGWMLLHNKLEIRLILVQEEGKILPSSIVDQYGIFHNKVGIFKDDSGNIVSFSGSINETYGGLVRNIESFEVFCSWKNGAEEHIMPHIDRFERYWDIGKCGRSITVEFPDAIKNKWISSVPKRKEDLSIFKKTVKGIRVRDYQTEAINQWFKNDCRGIFNMATGTGKTLTAIFAVKRKVEELKKPFTLIVAVPNQHLIKEPWVHDIEKYLIDDNAQHELITAYSGNNKWLSDLKNAQLKTMLKQTSAIVIVTTYDTLCSDKFVDSVKKLKTDKLLIADEVHNAGAEIYRTGLLDEYKYRLGLSATPARYLDDEGTDFLINYFDKEVFEFSLQKAINTINPDTGKTFLTPYKYYPIFVSLNEEEIQEYASYSKKIVAAFSIEEPTLQQRHYLSKLLIQRARIGKNAAQKYTKFRELIPTFYKNGVFDHCLVYCSDGKDPEDGTTRCIESVVSMLNEADITNRRFNSSDDNEERREILKHFANGDTSTLVAIKCLDEGVDVPSTKNAIILASTGNPREYIQRRGRILRHSEGKEFALLYDFVIIPGNIPGYHETENQIFNVEYRRFREFSSSSINKEENEKIINQVIQNYHIKIESEDEQWFRL